MSDDNVSFGGHIPDSGQAAPTTRTTPAVPTSSPGTFDVSGNYVPLSTGGSATDMASALINAEFANWEQTYKPIELNLLNQSSLNNPNVLIDAVGNARTSANQSFDALAGVEQRKLAAQGVAPTAQQAQVSARVRNLSRAAAVAGAENRARQNVATQDELIALGAAPNPNIVQQSVNSKA